MIATRGPVDRSARQLFTMVDRHVRRKFDDLARRSNNQGADAELCEGLVPAPASSASGLSPDRLG
jgi:hypothetical protein